VNVVASIALPTRRRLLSVLEALGSILCQETRYHYEVLVLDNASEPLLETEVGSVVQNSTTPVYYWPVPEIGLHHGRHTGARKARGEILVFVDDDIIADPGWLESILATFEDPSVALVGGRYLPAYEQTPPEWADAFWTEHDHGRWCGYLSLLDFGQLVQDIDPTFVWGLSFAIRKQILLDLGGFHPDSMPWELRRYRGDGETAVSLKAKQLGLRAIYQPHALVYHKVTKERITIEYFESRAYLQGISDSYSAIRSNQGLAASATSKGRFGLKSSFSCMKRLAGQWLCSLRLAREEPYREVKERVWKAYLEGYHFHQDEVRHDPELLKWVLKEDYWD
jgi:glucosyl-dolichyl phosphate glucuronosyltransferase